MRSLLAMMTLALAVLSGCSSMYSSTLGLIRGEVSKGPNSNQSRGGDASPLPPESVPQ